VIEVARANSRAQRANIVGTAMSLSDKAKGIAERMFEYESHVTALKKIFFKKFNKVLPALTVTKFFQLDRRIDLLADMNLEPGLPPLTQARDTTVTQPHDTEQPQ
jgi:hypothetical protein